MIIGIVGEKLAGKDEAAKHLQDKYGAFYVKYSRIIDEILNILDLPISRRNEIDLGRALRGTFQTNIFWRGMKKRLLESQADIKVIGSIRLRDEFDDAKAMGAKIIYITAPAELRYKRIFARHEKTEDGRQTAEQFLAQEREWTEKEIPSLGAQADFRIENAGTLEELHGKIDEVISKCKNQNAK